MNLILIKIKLYVKYSSSEEDVVNLEMDFLSHARMSKASNYSIWDNYFIKYYGKMFKIKNYSYFKMIKSEFSVLKNIFALIFVFHIYFDYLYIYHFLLILFLYFSIY